MKSKIIVLRAKISYMLTAIMKLWCIINSNGTHNNEWYFEDVVELEENINELYNQATMSENEYSEYIKNELEIDVFKESVKI